MKKLLFVTLCAVFFNACTPNDTVKNSAAVKQKELKLYSREVKDTFFISVYLPDNMERTKTYPVIYLLDANLYFDVMASAFKKYSEVDLLPEAILVGIGYKNIQTMDSLRNRDLTYPIAIPEYEMPASGKADKFLLFINKELVPYIDVNYRSDKAKRVLMGHSLGGYFTLYAMQQDLLSKENSFNAYIAASPSTHYDNYYILKEFERTNGIKDQIKTYITFGGLEDEEEDSTMLKCNVVLSALTKSLKEKNKIDCKGDMYSNLDHMNTGFPTFVKGIQWVFEEEHE